MARKERCVIILCDCFAFLCKLEALRLHFDSLEMTTERKEGERFVVVGSSGEGSRFVAVGTEAARLRRGQTITCSALRACQFQDTSRAHSKFESL